MDYLRLTSFFLSYAVLKGSLAQAFHPLLFIEKSDGLEKVLWHKLSIHLRLTTNPMVWKSFLVHKRSICYSYKRNRMGCKRLVWHKLSIHDRLVFISDGGSKQERPNGPHPFFDLIKSDGWSRQERPNGLHPLSGSSKKDGAPEQFNDKCLDQLHQIERNLKKDGAPQ